MCRRLSRGGRIPGLNPRCRAAGPHQAQQGKGLPNPTPNEPAWHALPGGCAPQQSTHALASPIPQVACLAGAELSAGKAAAQGQLLGSAHSHLSTAIRLDATNEQGIMAEVCAALLAHCCGPRVVFGARGAVRPARALSCSAADVPWHYRIIPSRTRRRRCWAVRQCGC